MTNSDFDYERMVAGLPEGKTANGISYRYRGEGPPLILFHGGAGSWTHWIRNITPLSRSFSVYALDSPGYGQSRDVDADIPIDGYIEILVDAVRELIAEEEKFHISGFSFGSFIAAAVAMNFRQSLDSISLVGISGFYPPVKRDLDLISLRRLKVRLGREPGSQEVADMHKHNLLQLMLLHEATIDDDVIRIQATNVANTRFDSRRLSWSGRMQGYLKAIPCRKLLILGDNDKSVYPSTMVRAEICKSIDPGMEIQILEDCGHWSQFEEPDIVNEIMLRFHSQS